MMRLSCSFWGGLAFFLISSVSKTQCFCGHLEHSTLKQLKSSSAVKAESTSHTHITPMTTSTISTAPNNTITATAITLADVEAAAERLKGRVLQTPCLECPTLADLVGASAVYLKMETFQRTGAFKERGAANKLLTLTPAERAAGVVTASAGNHGQGVALHAKRLGIKATVCMPTTTPQVKVERVRGFGAEVCKVGSTFEEARNHAEMLVRDQGMTMVHPYDDPIVMAGQGTIALEMLAEHPDIDTLIVQVGGGGLAAGIFTAARALRPDITCIAAQTSTFPSLPNRDHPTLKPVAGAATIADGIAVHRAGDRTSTVLAQLGIRGCDVVLVKESVVERAIVTLAREMRVVVEGAGATGVAALLAAHDAGDVARYAGKHIGLVLSGGNIDMLVLSEVIERCMARTGSLAHYTLCLPDRPGMLATTTTLIGTLGGNIQDIVHQRTFSGDLDIKHTRLTMTVITEGAEHSQRIATSLTTAGFPTTLDSISTA